MAPLTTFVAHRPFHGGPHCGDVWARWDLPGGALLCLADGLGHGPRAEIAGRAAVDWIGEHRTLPILDIFAGADTALHSTRGVALAVARIDYQASALEWAGVGNIRGRMLGDQQRSLGCDPGIIGAGYAHLHTETIPFQHRDMVVLFTDGLPERLELRPPYPPPDAAQSWVDTLVRDHARHNDDAALVLEILGAP